MRPVFPVGGAAGVKHVRPALIQSAPNHKISRAEEQDMTKLTKVEYGVPTDKCAIAARLGVERGIFEDEGLDLSVKIVFGGPEIAEAYESGALCIGEMGSPPAINAIAAGKPFTIIGSGCRRRAHMFLGVRAGINSFEELRGKRLGLLGLGSCPDWIARKMLIREGLDPDKDIVFVPLLDQYPRIIEIMEEGGIDACLASEPNLSVGEEKGLLTVWAAGYDAPYLPDYQWIVRVARTDLIERDPELVAAVLRGCRRSAHYAAGHVDEWVAFAAGQYGISEAAARRAVERELPHFHLDCHIDMAGLQNSVDMQHELAGIAHPMRADEFVDLRFQPDLSVAA
jgi:ABC-type nitrate/sulfonate/bicarbonate transport system substrate-binding protein